MTVLTVAYLAGASVSASKSSWKIGVLRNWRLASSIEPLVKRLGLALFPKCGGKSRQPGVHGRLIHRQLGLNKNDKTAVAGFHKMTCFPNRRAERGLFELVQIGAAANFRQFLCAQ